MEFLVLYRIPAQGAYSEWLAEIMNDVWDNRLPDQYKVRSRLSFRFGFAKDNPVLTQPGDPLWNGRGEQPTMRYSANEGTAAAPMYTFWQVELCAKVYFNHLFTQKASESGFSFREPNTVTNGG